MELFAKAAAMGVIGCILATLLRRYSKEQAMLLELVTAGAILVAGAALLRPVTEVAAALEEASGASPALITPVYKCLGIALVTQLAAEVCRDAGDGAVAQSIGFVGTTAALYAAAPLLMAVLKLIRELLEG